MTEALAAIAIELALDVLSNIAWDYFKGEMTEDTEIVIDQLISGTGQYYYIDSSGAKYLKHGTYTFANSLCSDGMSVIQTPDYSEHAVLQNIQGARPSVAVTNALIQISSPSSNPAFRFDVSWSENTYTAVSVDRTSIPTYYATGSLQGSDLAFETVSVATDNYKSTVQQYYSGSNYPAFVKAGTYNFNSLKAELINNFEVTYDIDLNITPEDLPTLEDIVNPTEPTETVPSGDGFTFDYDEVISPSELEDILNQETYDWNEVDTELIELPELPTIPAYEADQNEADVLTAIPVIATASMNMLGSLGLLSVFTSIAIVKMILKVLRNKKGGDD